MTGLNKVPNPKEDKGVAHMKTKQRIMKVMSWWMIISMVLQMFPFSVIAAYAQDGSDDSGWKTRYSNETTLYGQVEITHASENGTCQNGTGELKFILESNDYPDDFQMPANQMVCIGDTVRLPHIDTSWWYDHGYETTGWKISLSEDDSFVFTGSTEVRLAWTERSQHMEAQEAGGDTLGCEVNTNSGEFGMATKTGRNNNFSGGSWYAEAYERSGDHLIGWKFDHWAVKINGVEYVIEDARKNDPILFPQSYDDPYADGLWTEREYIAYCRPVDQIDDSLTYRVEYYLENGNGRYAFNSSYTETGEPGDLVYGLQREFPGYTFNAVMTGNQDRGVLEAGGNLVLKLYYDANPYRVIYEYIGTVPEGANPSSENLPPVTEYKYGQSVTVINNATAPAGWVFNGWSTGNFTMPNHDVVIRGSFTQLNPGQQKYKVHYHIDGPKPAGYHEPRPSEYYPGQGVRVADQPEVEGYLFEGWRKDGKDPWNPIVSYFDMGWNDVHMWGKFTQLLHYRVEHYTIDKAADGKYYKSDARLYTTETGKTGKPNDRIFANPISIDGYHFSGQMTGSENKGILTQDNQTLKVYYLKDDVPEKYPVHYRVETIGDGSGGSVTPTDEYDVVTSCENIGGSTASANTGYSFVGWFTENGTYIYTNGPTLSDVPLRNNLNRNGDNYAETTFIAKFAKNFKVTYDIIEGPAECRVGYPKTDIYARGEVDGNIGQQNITIITPGECEGYIFYAAAPWCQGIRCGNPNGWYFEEEGGIAIFGNDKTLEPPLYEYNFKGYYAQIPSVVVTITGNTDTVTYNGQQQQVEGYTVTSISDPTYTVDMFNFIGQQAIAQGTNASETPYPMGLNATLFQNTNNKYNVRFVVNDGWLKINPKPVTVTAQNKEFTYNGTAQSWPEYDVVGLVGTDAISAVVTGSITFPSESPVTNELTSYTFTAGDPNNYSVTTANGELTMTNASVAITITARIQR